MNKKIFITIILSVIQISIQLRGIPVKQSLIQAVSTPKSGQVIVSETNGMTQSAKQTQLVSSPRIVEANIQAQNVLLRAKGKGAIQDNTPIVSLPIQANGFLAHKNTVALVGEGSKVVTSINESGKGSTVQSSGKGLVNASQDFITQIENGTIMPVPHVSNKPVTQFATLVGHDFVTLIENGTIGIPKAKIKSPGSIVSEMAQNRLLGGKGEAIQHENLDNGKTPLTVQLVGSGNLLTQQAIVSSKGDPNIRLVNEAAQSLGGIKGDIPIIDPTVQLVNEAAQTLVNAKGGIKGDIPIFDLTDQLVNEAAQSLTGVKGGIKGDIPIIDLTDQLVNEAAQSLTGVKGGIKGDIPIIDPTDQLVNEAAQILVNAKGGIKGDIPIIDPTVQLVNESNQSLVASKGDHTPIIAPTVQLVDEGNFLTHQSLTGAKGGIKGDPSQDTVINTPEVQLVNESAQSLVGAKGGIKGDIILDTPIVAPTVQLVNESNQSLVVANEGIKGDNTLVAPTVQLVNEAAQSLTGVKGGIKGDPTQDIPIVQLVNDGNFLTHQSLIGAKGGDKGDPNQDTAIVTPEVQLVSEIGLINHPLLGAKGGAIQDNILIDPVVQLVNAKSDVAQLARLSNTINEGHLVAQAAILNAKDDPPTIQDKGAVQFVSLGLTKLPVITLPEEANQGLLLSAKGANQDTPTVVQATNGLVNQTKTGVTLSASPKIISEDNTITQAQLVSTKGAKGSSVLQSALGPKVVTSVGQATGVVKLKP